MSYFKEWGFSQPPFTTDPLPGTALGSRLLIGREAEVRALLDRLSTPPKMAALEAMNGLGKTSLTNVAAYRSLHHHLQTGTGPVFVPCRVLFQLTADEQIDSFLDKVYGGLAETIASGLEELERADLYIVRPGPVERWLSLPSRPTCQAGPSRAGLGPLQQSATHAGERTASRREVEALLRYIFPQPTDGGIVCVLENLELLRYSLDTMRFLEELRDPLFRIPGVRWVLCGSHGVVQGVARSPRLDGTLHTPIRLECIDTSNALEILTSRLREFSASPQRPRLPLKPQAFVFLYDIMGGNLRSTMSELTDYCVWVHERHPEIDKAPDHQELFQRWLLETSEEQYLLTRDLVRPTAWRDFDRIVKLGGSINLRDALRSADARSEADLRAAINELVYTSLLSDGMRRPKDRDEVYFITSKGRKVNFARKRESRLSRASQ